MIMDIPAIEPTPVYYECVVAAAKRFELPPAILFGIIKVEGGKVGKAIHNKNGSHDLGPMQINTVWLQKFAPYVSPSKILYNGCVNVQVGAWILKSRINEAGDFWDGVGRYHSRTPERGQHYRKLVYNAVQKMRLS